MNFSFARGLLGILYQAAETNLIDLSTKFKELEKTSFFVSPNLLKLLLNKINELSLKKSDFFKKSDF